MPLWLIALIFVIGLAWIAERFVDRLSQTLVTRVGNVLRDELKERLAYLYQATENLDKGVGEAMGKIERLLEPMAAVAEYRLAKIGWDRFVELHRKMDETIISADQEKRRRKLMRDERGFMRLVYEGEVAAALQKGWTTE